MKFGAPFWGAYATRDPFAIRDYVQAVEGMGYEYLFMDEVLLNDNPDEIFHESLTLFAYLAGVTTSLKFVTGVMILPKRSTIMVARQAAEVDVLSGGRLRLGVGVGWSEREYRALGVDFRTRGKRIEEQIALLRALWTRPQVTFKGTYHDLEEIGINLLPVNRPIPVWMGGGADVVLRRTARLADGWVAYMASRDEFAAVVRKLRTYLVDYDRDPADFVIVNYLHTGKAPRESWLSTLKEWQDLGVTHAVILPPSGWEPGAHRLDEAVAALCSFRTLLPQGVRR